MSQPESSPLLRTPSSSSRASAQDQQSHADLALANTTRGTKPLLAQAGLALFAAVVIWILIANPAGLFSPSAQLGALILLAQGILLLQPTSTADQKAKGLDLHQAAQGAGLLLAITGVSAIYYNKYLHGAKHFTSWHGISGIITLALLVVQAVVGFAIGRQPGQNLLGTARAKSLWKWHRASGYLVLALLFITPLLATQASDWMVQHSAMWQRAVMGLALIVAWAGVTFGLNPRKIQLVGTSKA